MLNICVKCEHATNAVTEDCDCSCHLAFFRSQVLETLVSGGFVNITQISLVWRYFSPRRWEKEKYLGEHGYRKAVKQFLESEYYKKRVFPNLKEVKVDEFVARDLTPQGKWLLDQQVQLHEAFRQWQEKRRFSPEFRIQNQDPYDTRVNMYDLLPTDDDDSRFLSIADQRIVRSLARENWRSRLGIIGNNPTKRPRLEDKREL